MFRNQHVVKSHAPHKETLIFLSVALFAAFFIVALVTQILATPQSHQCLRNETCMVDSCKMMDGNSSSSLCSISHCEDEFLDGKFECSCLEKVFSEGAESCAGYNIQKESKSLDKTYNRIWGLLFVLSLGFSVLTLTVTTVYRICRSARSRNDPEQA